MAWNYKDAAEHARDHDCRGDLGHAGSCGHDAWRRDTEEVC